MKLFKEEKENLITKQKKVQFVQNIYSMLSRDSSMSNEEKQKILVGSLLHTGLAKEAGMTNDVVIEILSKP